MNVTVIYEPTNYHPVWFYLNTPARVTSVWRWEEIWEPKRIPGSQSDSLDQDRSWPFFHDEFDGADS